MKFAEHLSREQVRLFNQMRREERAEKKVEKPVKVKEQLSRKEWEELMGTRRDTYKRVKGALRRK
ncbi:hypothetical protein ACQCVK_04185 [Rossellomorea vietnamensis]|uniref:hypothetical protein n=1 Tax=Rossellomorea vietnamensis TaxID=218284 RepID=UPI003CF6BE1C